MAVTLFELQAKLGINTSEFNTGVDNAKESMEGFSTEGMTAKAVALGNALYDVTVKALEMGVALGKAVFAEYADTEQLLGGVETIFGDSADTVVANAQRAYQTAGMSANDYMSTVIGFSSRLLQGLEGDTEAAAAYADMALTDMADNANKFGTSIGMVENAYQGFSRNNFTMLDNLKLGYGGTQEEMARLINDSGVMAGLLYDDAGALRDVVVGDLKDGTVPLYKMVEAIHAIQEEMGVTGTTAAEASGTLSGSSSAFDASWENLLAGLADKNADIDELMSNLVSTATTMVTNYTALIPTILENSLAAITSLFDNSSKGLDEFSTEYTGKIAEIESTTTQADALIAELGKMEENGETDSYRWNAILASLKKVIPDIGTLIDTSNGTIQGGVDALRGYVDEWEATAKELATQQALQGMYDEYGSTMGEIIKLQTDQQIADAREAAAAEKMQQHAGTFGGWLQTAAEASGWVEPGENVFDEYFAGSGAGGVLAHVALSNITPEDLFGDDIMQSLATMGITSRDVENLAALYAAEQANYDKYSAVDNTAAIAQLEELLATQKEELAVLRQILDKAFVVEVSLDGAPVVSAVTGMMTRNIKNRMVAR